jgi:2',3'-cyclic-nucleotide 2'-phosphodiesterase
MKILFIGDVVGSPGRAIVGSLLPVLKKQYDIDFIIANGENAAHGKGITNKIANFFVNLGIDVITLGNHAYAKREVHGLDAGLPIVFPANLKGPYQHQHTYIVTHQGVTIAVSNLCGSAFMDNITESPFDAMDKILLKVKADIHVVDFHGEATAEKKAFAYHYANTVSAIIGTHTHVQTADEQIINNTIFITDVGMCGSYQSILGRDIEEAINKMVYHENTHYKPSSNPALFCGLVMTFNEQHMPVDVTRLYLKPSES